MAIVHVASTALDIDVSDAPLIVDLLGHVSGLVSLPEASTGHLTLKVDGLVFHPSSNVPADASVLEVIEAHDVPDVPVLASGGVVSAPVQVTLGDRGPEQVTPIADLLG